MSKSPFISMVADEMYKKHYAKRTIETYVKWICSYIRFHNKRHPAYMHDTEVEAYLSHLVLQLDAAANTQTTALNALVFLYKEIIQQPLTLKLHFIKSHRQTKLPVVLTTDEMRSLLQYVCAKQKLPILMLYGSGLRLMECARLRVQDIDFDFKSVRIWNGKGGKHRVVTLADNLIPALRRQISIVHQFLNDDLDNPNFGGS